MSAILARARKAAIAHGRSGSTRPKSEAAAQSDDRDRKIGNRQRYAAGDRADDDGQPSPSAPAATRVLTAARAQSASVKASGSAIDSTIRPTFISTPRDDYPRTSQRDKPGSRQARGIGPEHRCHGSPLPADSISSMVGLSAHWYLPPVDSGGTYPDPERTSDGRGPRMQARSEERRVGK